MKKFCLLLSLLALSSTSYALDIWSISYTAVISYEHEGLAAKEEITQANLQMCKQVKSERLLELISNNNLISSVTPCKFSSELARYFDDFMARDWFIAIDPRLDDPVPVIPVEDFPPEIQAQVLEMYYEFQIDAFRQQVLELREEYQLETFSNEMNNQLENFQ